MIQTSFENKVQIQDIIDNQIPEFIASESPKFTEFLKQYYISQEIQGGNVDIVENLPYYLKLDNMTPEVLNSSSELTQDVTTDATKGITSEIFVTTTEGFPKKHGLIQIDEEIISYKSKTSNSFVDCVRNFSGIAEYGKSLSFSSTNIASHTSGTKVINLSVLFLGQFYQKIKNTLLTELESTTLNENLKVNTFLKNTTSLYKSKGSKESFRILFNALFGIEPEVVDLEKYVIKSSNSDFRRRREVLCELLTSGDHTKIIGQQLTKTNDTNVFGSISEVEVLTRENRLLYKILLYVGYDDFTATSEGEFLITPSTKLIDSINSTDLTSTLTVDSTIGFPESGVVYANGTKITYTEKTINQFLNCYTEGDNYINLNIPKVTNIHSDDTYFAYEDGDTSKKLEFRLLGSVRNLNLTYGNPNYISHEGEKIIVDSLGMEIKNTNNNNPKQTLANSFVYNTSVRIPIIIGNFDGSTAETPVTLDKSFLKTGDTVEFLSRNSEIVPEGYGDVKITAVTGNEIIFGKGLTSLNSDGKYDIRRKVEYASSTSLPLAYDNLTTNIVNLYDENRVNFYVASNSLPSYTISKDIIKSTVDTVDLSSFNPLKDGYYRLILNNLTSFIDGDQITYTHTGEPINGLKSGNYYVTVEDKKYVKLYRSNSSISIGDFIYFPTNYSGPIVPEGTHTFTLSSQQSNDNKIHPSKSFRKIKLNDLLTEGGGTDKVDAGFVGILVNGVDILSPITQDKIYYGPLSSVDVYNGGSGYDVINPPELRISGDAKIQPVVQGKIEKVFVDPMEFDVNEPIKVTISGGNGRNASLQPQTKVVSREVPFNARPLNDGGGIDEDDDTITFLTDHNFYNGQKIYYISDNINNPKIGISTFGGANQTDGTYLENNTSYYAKVVNSSTIRIHPSLSDYRAGINTVGLSTEGNFGIHKFRTDARKILSNIVVENPGEGYTSRKLTLNQSGISTITDRIAFVNHGFSDGELVKYDYETSPISGLSTSNQYYILKVDDHSFRLCDAGIGGTDTSFYDREKYVSIASSGIGYQYFDYPDISIDVSYIVDGERTVSPITATPVIKGSIVGAYLYEKGSNYGSTTLNVEESPIVEVVQGREASFRPIITEGKIERVEINYGGYDYKSTPDLKVISDKGIGAELRAIISNGSVASVKVIEGGLNYSYEDIKIVPSFDGKDFVADISIRSLIVDTAYKYGVQYDNYRDPSYELLYKNNREVLQYAVTGYSDLLKSEFNEDPNVHSPIIGWAYDGNPIYGPFGYENPEKISTIRLIKSSYVKDTDNVENRPTNSVFNISDPNSSYFVEDYKYDGSGDLDRYNGRWCITPEYPNGVYAYFATARLNTEQQYVGTFPYFVGLTYRSPLIRENVDASLSHSFDFNNSDLLRNTFPYKSKDLYATYDFFPINRATINQTSEIISVTKGSIDQIGITSAGKNYQVGDKLNFTTNGTGNGLSVKVESLEGKPITSITNTSLKYSNSNLYPNGTDGSIFYILPSHNLRPNTKVTITGLSTEFAELNGDHIASVDQFTTRATDEIVQRDYNASAGVYHQSRSGIVTDIKLDSLPTRVSIGSSIRLKPFGGDDAYYQHYTILNSFKEDNIIRCRKTGGVGLCSATTEIEFLPHTVKIDALLPDNDLKFNYKRYFNPQQSIGIGTWSGVNSTISFHIGTRRITKTIPTRSLYIPNHGFKDREKVIMRKANSSSGNITIQMNDNPTSTKNLLAVNNQEVLYVIKKTDDIIGIQTSIDAASTTDGLIFANGINAGSNNFEYSLESAVEEETAIIYQNKSTVSVSTVHGLKDRDFVNIEVVPNIQTGIGNSTILNTEYISKFKSISFKTFVVSAGDVNSDTNEITIENHLLNGGERVSFVGSDIPSGIDSETAYYVSKVDIDTIKLSETYKESISKPSTTIKFVDSGSGNHEIKLLDSNISAIRNNTLFFDVSDASLEGYNIKFYYDNECKNEFVSGISTQFPITRVGAVGLGSTATISLKYDNTVPDNLYYALVDGNDEKINYTENKPKIFSTVSHYNGVYEITDVEDLNYSIYLSNTPERPSYSDSDCSVIKYDTTSKTANGSVSSTKIESGGINYNDLPVFEGSDSQEGSGLSILPRSTSIGKIINKVDLNSGFEYSVDRTISPSTKTSLNANIKNSQVLKSISIVQGGSGYPNAPKLVVVDTDTGIEIDQGLLLPVMSGSTLGNSNIEDVEIQTPLNGLPSTPVTIRAVENSNAIRIDKVTPSISDSRHFTCLLKTPILGYGNDPFQVGDEVFIENIESLTDTGVGFNSKDHGYAFFEVIDYVADSNPGEVTLQIPKLYGNPGVAVTFQIDSFAGILKKDNYPLFRVEQEPGLFFENESISILDRDTGIYVNSDLKITKSNKNYVKLLGDSDVFVGDTIKGLSSGTIAVIDAFDSISGQFTIEASAIRDYGWVGESGKLNSDTQFIADNDYYQNLSYTIRSEKTWDEIKEPVNSTVHPIGTKNFADTQITGIATDAGVTDNRAKDSILENIQSFIRQSRVDVIKNFDNVLDEDPVNDTSKFIKFKNIQLSDFFRAETNRVLNIDNIAGQFSSSDDESFDSKIIAKSLPERRSCYKFLVQTKSIDNETYNHIQFNEVIALYDGSANVYFISKSNHSNKAVNSKPSHYASLEMFTNDVGLLNLQFIPENDVDFDYEIKILSSTTSSSVDNQGSQSFGSVNIFADTTNLATTDRVVLNTFDASEYNVLFTEAHIENLTFNTSEYVEMTTIYDGTNVIETKYDFESTEDDISSLVGIGTLSAEKSGSNLELYFQSLDGSSVRVNTKTYAFGDYAGGTSTYRYLTKNQSAGSERTAIIDNSVISTGTETGFTTTRTYPKDNFSSIKSFVRVAVNDKIDFHEIINLHDGTDSYIVESPVVSSGRSDNYDTIGEFTSVINGANLELRFERNTEYSNSDVQITQLDYKFYSFLDELNKPQPLQYGNLLETQSVAKFFGVNSPNIDRTNFRLEYERTPIYAKTFDPADSDILDPATGTFNIDNHFFSTGERLIYTPGSTFIGIGKRAMKTSSNTDLPTEVYAIKIDNNTFQIASSTSNAETQTQITFNPSDLGEGNAHMLEMYVKNEKTLITVNDLAQYPLLYTGITHNLDVNVGVADSFFSLTGISSLGPQDILKVNDEYMKISNVGIGTTSKGPILYFSGDKNIVSVERGVVGSAATTHTLGDVAYLYRGSYNIVGDELHFTNPPRGNIGDLASKDERNLLRARATFQGRTFLRKDYSTNDIYDDFSDDFDGKTTSFELKTLGVSTVGLGTTSGNGMLFLNGILQTPETENVTDFNFKLSSNDSLGITTITFTGVTTSNGKTQISESDVNQNQLPRGGIIVSLGSSAGLGFAPLVGAKVRLEKDSLGGIQNVVSVGGTSGDTVAITTAKYDNENGTLTIVSTESEIYKLVQPKVNHVRLVGLSFTCNSGNGTVISFPQLDDDKPRDIIGIGATTVTVDVGISTLEHYYVGYGTVYPWYSDLTEGSGYRSPVSVSLRDAAEDYEHKFVRTNDESVGVQGSSVTFTPTFATYEPTTGVMVLTMENHGLTDSDFVTLTTGSIYFTCSSDSHVREIGYPRATDPAAGIATAITSYTSDTISVNVGSMVGSGGEIDVTVGAGGTLGFTVSSAGSNYTQPILDIDDPSYGNLEVIGVSRLGVGQTTEVGVNMRVSVDVGPALNRVGVGSTLFEVSKFEVSREGYGFQNGDVLTVVGLVTDKSLSEPLEKFQLYVLDTYKDSVAAWQFGELNRIDDLKPYQNGKRLQYPLYYQTELLSFQKDTENSDSLDIDFNSLLVIFVNGILQKPGYAYEFNGGSSFRFTTAPKPNDDVKVFFYVGTRGEDSSRIDVNETIKVGDILKINKIDDNTLAQDPRMVFDIVASDIVETSLYTGDGINDNVYKPVDWIKQREDVIINEITYSKSRQAVEPQIYPTAKIISDLNTTDTVLYVDNANLFNYEEKASSKPIDIDLIPYQINNKVGVITATVSAAGTISQLNIVDAGIGYTSAARVKISNPIIGIGDDRSWYSVGIGTPDTYSATTTGSVGINSNQILVENYNNINIGDSVNSITKDLILSGTTVLEISNPGGNVGLVTISKLSTNTTEIETTFNFGTLSRGSVGVGSTATATVTITDGVITSADIVNPGSGYTSTNPPQVVVDFPEYNEERITNADVVVGLYGNILGIGTTPGIGGAELALSFQLRETTKNQGDYSDISVGQPIYIYGTSIGEGITSIDFNDTDTVGIGTTALDCVYKVQYIDTNTGIITCNILSTTNISGDLVDGITGTALSPVGKFSFGKISGFSRGSNPVSFAVTSYTVSGLGTYGLVKRKGSNNGLRKTGALISRSS
jgi:hypothetical protein